MTKNLKKLTLSVTASALLAGNAFAYPTINITTDTTDNASDIIYNYNISDSVTLTLNKGGAAYYGKTYFGVISGQGSIKKTGIGSVSFEGNNTYTGNTDIIEGTLELFSGNAIADVGIINIHTDGILEVTYAETVGEVFGSGKIFLRSNLTTGMDGNYSSLSGELSGYGSLTKTGNGVLTLSANNTYTGNTNVNGGTLAVTADTSSSNFVINNSGILSGNGTVGNTTVKNGGVIYPTGTSTLNVDGNLTFENGSIYRLNANRLAQSGKIAVSGTASIDGNVEVKADNSGTWNTSTNYEILSANSISGTFDGVSSDLAFLTPTLQYNQTGKVNLTLARNNVDYSDIITNPEPTPTANTAISNLGYVNSLQDNTFTIFDASNPSKAKTINVTTGYDSLVINPTVTSVYATNRDSGTVGVFNPTNGTFTNTSIDVDNRPLGIVMNSDGSTAYVANAQSGTISVINTASNTVINTIDTNAYTQQVGTDTSPARMALSPDGTKLYVTDDQDTHGNSIFVIDTTTNSIIKEITTGTQAIGITLNQDGTKAYIANENADKITVINLQNDTTSTIDVGTYPVGVVLSKDETKLYVTNAGGDSISIINTSTNIVTDTIINVAGVAGISISPDGSKLYATNYNSNTLYMIDTTTNQVTTYNNISTSTSENISPSFISANLITGTLEVPTVAYLESVGFDNYVNFAGGTLKATGSFTLSNPVYLHDAFNITWDDSSTFTTVVGGTVNTNGYDVTFSGEVSGVGSLTKTGNGVLTLSSNNTYTGNTNVNGGTLAVTADTSSSNFVVNNSGILSGNGTVGNTTVKNGGVIYPSETSTLNVDGNLTFENGSIYRLNANRLAQSGKIAVSGTASLDGNVEVKADNNGTWNPSTNYEILSANSISGTFDGVSSDLAFLTPTLQYNQTGKVNLTLARNDVNYGEVIDTEPTPEPTPTPILTSSDYELLQVTRVLDKANELNILGMQDVFTSLNGMNASQAKNAYRQLLGSSLVINNTHSISNSINTFNTNVFDRLAKLDGTGVNGLNSGDETLIGNDNSKYNFWSRVLGGLSKLDGDVLRSEVNSKTAGVQFGAEKISDEIVFGTSFAYIGSNIDFKNDEAKSELDTYLLGLYGQKIFDNNIFVNAEINVGQNKTDTSRITPIGWASSSPKSNTISSSLEVGYKFDLSNNLFVKPSVIAGYSHLEQKAYSELGAGGANLSIDKYDSNISNLGLNLKTQKVFTQNNKDFADIEFGVGYVKEFGDTNKALNASFATAPSAGSFEINGIDKDENKYIANLTTNYYIDTNSSLFASLNGSKSSDEESINGILGVKIGF